VVAEALTIPVPGDADGPSTRDVLMAAGLRCFAASGYAGSRLVDITSEAQLTTGAFYRHFASKADFLRALCVDYGEALQEALAEASGLEEQFVAWIDVAREHRGVVRAATEVLRRDSPEAIERRRLRDRCASLMLPYLQDAGDWRKARAASLLLVDVLDQYALMEAAGWVEERQPTAVGVTLRGMVEQGLYAK
jgi:AcrR family transcriptional regulator